MLTKPNILRLVFFVLVFAGVMYYPVREVLSYERPKHPPREFRFGIADVRLKEDAGLRPKVSGRWQWVDYIFPRAEKANKLRLDLKAPECGDAPKLTYVYYPMSRKLAERTLRQLCEPAVKDKAELVVKCYANGRWRVEALLIDGRKVSEPKMGAAAAE